LFAKYAAIRQEVVALKKMPESASITITPPENLAAGSVTGATKCWALFTTILTSCEKWLTIWRFTMKLTSKRRKALPTSEFAGPSRSYPVDTKNRAANAKARAAQQVNKGRMSKAEEAKIDAKADRKLKRK
jgi:hypothetical protein